MSEPDSSALGVLRDRNVALYIAQRFMAGSGMTLLTATIAWQVYELTGSPLQLGVLGAVRFAATALVSLIAGAAADSYDRRRIVMAAQAVSAIGALVLGVGTLTDVLDLPTIYAVVFLGTLASSFENPAGASILPTLVSREVFARATAVQASVRNVAWVSGPVLAGFLIEGFGAEGAYVAHVIAMSLAIVLMVGVRVPPVQSEPRGITVAAIQEGIAFVRSRPAILGAMTVDMMAVIFGAAEALLPVFARDVLDVGPRGYGILSASFQVGTLGMAVLLVALPPIQRAGRALLLAVAAYALATVAFGLSRVFWLSVCTYAAGGMADQVSMVARSVLIQLSTPDALRGRVNSVNFVFIGASNHLGAVEAGVVAALLGAPLAVVTGGLAAFAIAGLVAWRVPALRRYNTRDGGPGAEPVL